MFSLNRNPAEHSNEHQSHKIIPDLTKEKDTETVMHPMRRSIPPDETSSILTAFSELNIKKKPTCTSIPSISGEAPTADAQLLVVCGQTAPATFADVFSAYCGSGTTEKLGEGTYAEVYRAGNTVFKVVPFGRENQKNPKEIHDEVLLCRTLNSLRADQGGKGKENSCNGFTETKGFRVCQGPYHPLLVSAWEDWDAKRRSEDEKRGSENENPNGFSEDQCYVIFIQADGGSDLENSTLLDYNEARSLLLQVTVSLAVAESACEFEHRDLHWGNVLLARDEMLGKNRKMTVTLQGKRIRASTFGLSVSIIDFTLSRIKTGEDTLYFLDLTNDPDLFNQPKRDLQTEMYQKMKRITNERWDGSFPETNVAWLIYLVGIVLQKKSEMLPGKDKRDLRAFKKRLSSCSSARDCLTDPIFSDMLLEEEGWVALCDASSEVAPAGVNNRGLPGSDTGAGGHAPWGAPIRRSQQERFPPTRAVAPHGPAHRAISH